jgi:hypothetical protein
MRVIENLHLPWLPKRSPIYLTGPTSTSRLEVFAILQLEYIYYCSPYCSVTKPSAMPTEIFLDALALPPFPTLQRHTLAYLGYIIRILVYCYNLPK